MKSTAADFARRLLGIRGVHWLALMLGNGTVRRLSFDEKFRNGRWNFATPRGSELVEVVKKTVCGGNLLVAGCGTGSLIAALKPESFSSVLGLDISSEAISRARRYANAKVKFQLGDIIEFKPESMYDAILFSESLYYIKPWRRKPLLLRLQNFLAPQGFFIVTIAQPRRYAGILRMIRGSFVVAEDRPFADSERHLLVFR